jgi:hypothetical protein
MANERRFKLGENVVNIQNGETGIISAFDIIPGTYSVKTGNGYRMWGELDMTSSKKEINMGSKSELVEMSEELGKLTPESKRLAMVGVYEYFDDIARMNGVVKKMPRLYETDTDEFKGRHPLALHYFLGGCDWYISEWDREDSFFGYTVLNNDTQMSEWGYISLSELLSIETSLSRQGGKYRAVTLNLDYHCPYGTVEVALFHKDPKYFWKYDPARLQAGKEE